MSECPVLQDTQQSKKSSSIFVGTSKTFVDSVVVFIYQYSPSGNMSVHLETL